jgi:hypothetical protein
MKKIKFNIYSLKIQKILNLNCFYNNGKLIFNSNRFKKNCMYTKMKLNSFIKNINEFTVLKDNLRNENFKKNKNKFGSYQKKKRKLNNFEEEIIIKKIKETNQKMFICFDN